jgi:hypothetical protein
MSDTILKASDASTHEKIFADDKLTIPSDEDIRAVIKNKALAPLTGRKGGPLTWPPPANTEEGYVNRGSILSFDVIFYDYDVFLH